MVRKPWSAGEAKTQRKANIRRAVEKKKNESIQVELQSENAVVVMIINKGTNKCRILNAINKTELIL